MHFHEEEKQLKKESNRSDSEIGFTSNKQEMKSFSHFDSTNNLSPGPMISKEREKAVLKIPCWPAPVTNLVISDN